MRVENQPYGRLNEIIYDQAFTVHPYKHPTIGSMTDLEAASIEDVRDFFRTYYVPNNATLVLVGDFDTKEAHGAGARSTSAACRSPTQAGAARHSEGAAADEGAAGARSSESWPLPAVVVAHHITFDGHPDSYPLHIASKVLSDGQSSRIYREAGLREAARARRLRRRQHHRGSEPVLRGRDRAAGPDARGGDRRADRRARPAAKTSRSRADELQQAKNQFARDYILGPRVEQGQGRAARRTRSSSTTTSRRADGEFDIFMNITRRRRPARGADLLHSRRTGW